VAQAHYVHRFVPEDQGGDAPASGRQTFGDEEEGMIPLIAVPIYNRPDLLKRLVDSIDYPVAELLIINNGIGEYYIDKLQVQTGLLSEINNEGNTGCAGAWNQAINHAFNERKYPYVLIFGNDIQFTHGDLQKMHEAVTPETDFVSGNWAFSSWGLTRKGFDKLGWVDENYYPAYLEDGDYWRRVGLSNATISSADTHMIHGEAPNWGSSTIFSDRAFAKVVSEGHGRNWQYHIKKWGGRQLGATEKFTTPFNRGGSLSDWQLSPERLKQPHYRSHG
jgi:GT2 family glycosyltransferase